MRRRANKLHPSPAGGGWSAEGRPGGGQGHRVGADGDRWHDTCPHPASLRSATLPLRGRGGASGAAKYLNCFLADEDNEFNVFRDLMQYAPVTASTPASGTPEHARPRGEPDRS